MTFYDGRLLVGSGYAVLWITRIAVASVVLWLAYHVCRYLGRLRETP